MRCLAAFVGIASVLVIGLVLNMIAVLSALDSQSLDVALLMRGDLSQLVTYPAVWQVPDWPHAAQLVEVGPLVLMIAIGVILCRAMRKMPKVSSTWFAFTALVLGAVPYAVGAIALRDNTSASETGPWLVWMLHGPAYAAIVAVAFLVRGMLRNPESKKVQRRSAAPAMAG